VANSKPDGYTIGHITLGSLINNYLMYDVKYDPLKSFTYIAGIAELTGSVIVRPMLPGRPGMNFSVIVKNILTRSESAIPEPVPCRRSPQNGSSRNTA